MAEVRIEVTCPGCDRRFLVPAVEQGHVADCPRCQGWVDVPEVGRPPTPAEVEEVIARRTTLEYERQLQVAARQLEQSQEALDHRNRQDDRFDEFLDQIGELIERWKQLAGQMNRAIEALERRGQG